LLIDFAVRGKRRSKKNDNRRTMTLTKKDLENFPVKFIM
jgi:hypothetical protein